MKHFPSEEEVVQANREVYERTDFSQYESNPALFAPKRQDQIRSILQSLKTESSPVGLLDVGCGTGNILRLANGIFDERFGIDLSGSLLRELSRRDPKLLLCQSEARKLPFQDESFHFCTCYSVLHHLHSHEKVFREIHRVLRPGGTLYTDHDPNYYFHRFYYLFKYRLCRRVPSSIEEIAEYHRTHTSGLNPDKLSDILSSIGFQHVEIHYRLSDNPSLGRIYQFVRFLMRLGISLYPFKSLHTHFLLIARK